MIGVAASLQTDLQLAAQVPGKSVRSSGSTEVECLSAYLPACPQEIPFSGLFRDLKNSTVFEASGEHTVGAQYLRALRSLAPCMRELHAWPVAGLNHSCTFRYAGLAYVRGKFYTIFDNAMSIGIMDDRFQFRQGTVLHQLLVPFSMRPHLACGLDWAWW